MRIGNCLLLISLVLATAQVGNCWETYEMDLFDLVEEINANFYDYLGVTQEVTSKELKSTYRKLSLQWHPDRNSDPEAELKFRNIVSIYEILKDDKKRARYDEVLITGLPDWRHPSYYFRRARKLSTLELSIAISLIISIGHYFVLWAQHFEQKLTLEDRMSDVRKKLEKKQKKRNYKGSELDDINTELEDYYDSMQSPVMRDTLPYRFFWWSIAVVSSLPGYIKGKIMKTESVEEEIAESDEEVKVTRNSKKRENNEHLKLNPKKIEKSDIKANSTRQITPEKKAEEESLRKTNKQWTDKEKNELIKAINRYPAGTSNRWNQIADVLNRLPTDCINMEKQMKSNFNSATYLNSATWVEPKATVLSHKEAPVPSVKLDENSNIESKNEAWTQDQQASFESALKQFNKDTLNRWDRIAEKVPQKSKDDCINRYKCLVADLKKKQQRA